MITRCYDDIGKQWVRMLCAANFVWGVELVLEAYLFCLEEINTLTFATSSMSTWYFSVARGCKTTW